MNINNNERKKEKINEKNNVVKYMKKLVSHQIE
jgi:hypothetical protein